MKNWIQYQKLWFPSPVFLEEKRKRVGSQHWISHKTFKMQRFCSSHISKNWKFLIFFSFFKCASQIFNNSGNINHQNGSETCPKSTKNSRTKGFPGVGYYIVPPKFWRNGLCVRKAKMPEKKISENLFDGAASFRIIPCYATIRQN